MALTTQRQPADSHNALPRGYFSCLCMQPWRNRELGKDAQNVAYSGVPDVVSLRGTGVVLIARFDYLKR